jgi:tetratricopeptide (TPR) repeat protein
LWKKVLAMERNEYERIIKEAADGEYDTAMYEAKARLEGGDNAAYELLSDINVVMYQMSGEKKYLANARGYIDKAESEGIKLSTKRFAILLGMGDHAAARKLVDSETDEQTRLFLESLLLLEQQDVDAARKSLERLIAMQPQASEPYIVYSKVLYSSGEWAKAIELLRDAAERMPESFRKAEVAREFERISTLYNAENKSMEIGLFGIENSKWVLLNTDDFEPKSPEEFLGLIGLGMNENGHLMIVIPKDEKLLDLVKGDFLGMMPEGVDYRDLEFMLAQMKGSMG